MVRGLYSSATGMTVQRNKMDVLANNLVNLETTGFKRDYVLSQSFDEVLLERINDPYVIDQRSQVGPYNFGTHVDRMVTDFADGTLTASGRDTDLALAGGGFFTIETEQGRRYTRDGSFRVNSEGYLVTSEGGYVLGEGGRLLVGGDFTVAPQGLLTSDYGADRLLISAFEDNSQLRKTGDNLYELFGGGQPAAAADFTVRQGYLEASNVNAADEMVEMLSIYRAYEASQRALTMTDETLGMAASQIGRLG